MDLSSSALAHALPDQGVALTDRDGRITLWNPAAVTLTGVPEAEAIGRDLGALSGPDTAGALATLMSDAGPGSLTCTGWRRHGDGSRYWCTATVFPITGPDGRLSGFAEVFRDETGAHAVQADVDQRRAIVSAVGVAGMTVYSQDLDLRVTFLSAVPLGAPDHLEREDVVGLTEAEFLPPAVATVLAAHKRRVIATGEPARFDVTVPTADGERVIDNSIGPLRGEDGRVLGVATTFVEVTERREAEERYRVGERRLAEAEQLAGMGSWDLNLTSNEMTRSPGLLELYGMRPEDVPSGQGFLLDLVHPDDRARCEAAIRRALSAGGGFDLEYRVILPGGRLRTHRSVAEVLIDDTGRPVRLVGTIQDLTDARVTEDAVQRAASALNRTAADLQQVGRPRAPDRTSLGEILTKRQIEILALIAEGLSNGEIAARLFVSEGTVKWHVKAILRRLDVSNRAQAVARFLGRE